MFGKIHIQVEGGIEIAYPRMVRIQQKFIKEEIHHIPTAIQNEFSKDNVRMKIKQGMKVAIAVGSRGIANLQQIVASVVQEIKLLGGKPYIVPSMGSHGGATAEGQTKVLEKYGITEEFVGCPIFSSMETVQVGQLSNGLPLYFDKYAFESDGIIVIGRVKPHTDFKGTVESGLQKMIVIGLGNHNGASSLHSYGIDAFPEILPEAGKILIEKTNVALGVAIIENAYDKTFDIQVVPAEQIVEVEPQLLKKAKELMPRLLLNSIDVLVIDEIGKDISGTGMDPNITGRTNSGPMEGFNAPPIQKIVVRDITNKSHGNATGIGMADIITKGLLDKIDFSALYANTITSTILSAAKIPVVLQNDKEALAVALKTCNRISFDRAKIVWIKNTLQLEHIYVSEPCLHSLRDRGDIEILSESEFIQFDEKGNLTTMFNFKGA